VRKGAEAHGPGRYAKDKLQKMKDVLRVGDAKVRDAYVGKEQVVVVTDEIAPREPVRARRGRWGVSLRRVDGNWLIRDFDFLPDEAAVAKYLEEFRKVEPNAERRLPPIEGNDTCRSGCRRRSSRGHKGGTHVRTILRVAAMAALSVGVLGAAPATGPTTRAATGPAALPFGFPEDEPSTVKTVIGRVTAIDERSMSLSLRQPVGAAEKPASVTYTIDGHIRVHVPGPLEGGGSTGEKPFRRLHPGKRADLVIGLEAMVTTEDGVVRVVTVMSSPATRPTSGPATGPAAPAPVVPVDGPPTTRPATRPAAQAAPGTAPAAAAVGDGATARVRGDKRLLLLVADGFEANLGKLATWRGEATVETWSDDGGPPGADGPRRARAAVTFVYDRRADAARWEWRQLDGAAPGGEAFKPYLTAGLQAKDRLYRIQSFPLGPRPDHLHVGLYARRADDPRKSVGEFNDQFHPMAHVGQIPYAEHRRTCGGTTRTRSTRS
jgi:hypothetical protein